MDLDVCKRAEEGLPYPDMVIYMKLEPSVALTRSNKARERYDSLEFQKIVRTAYENDLKDDTWMVLFMSISLKSEQVFDSNRNKESIGKEISFEVERLNQEIFSSKDITILHF